MEDQETEEDNEQKEEQLRQTVTAYNTDMEERFKRRSAAREINIQPKRPDESSFSKLDSSLKKNTAFVRKVKSFSASQLSALLKDLTALNLTKYITEIASAITEARLKTVDVLPACELCCGLHRLYAEFEPALLDCWKKSLTQRTDDAKFRMDLRLFSESILCGLFNPKGLQLLSSVLMSLVHDLNSSTHVLAFCRGFGEEFAGLVPREISDAASKFNIVVFSSTVMPIEKHKGARTLFHDYYENFSKHLLKCHDDLQKFEKHSRNILQTKGELSCNRRSEQTEKLNEYNKLVDTTRQLSDILNLPMVQLPALEESQPQEASFEDMLSSAEDRTYGIWEDEETQSFYEILPNLHVFVPHLVPAEPAPSQEEASEVTEEQLDLEIELPPEETDPDKKEDSAEPDVGDTRTKLMLSDFITQLPDCRNRDTLDNMAIEFVLNLNTKHNRRKLARSLFAVNRTRLDLLPFYSRLVAIVHPVAADVSVELCHLLKSDFIYHVRKKDQINIETKIKVARFIGELVKFRLYSKLEALFCVKVLLSDFHHHHIEMLCNLLETCGRYLYNQTDCQARMKVYLEQMMRKKAVMTLDSRYVMMVENALYTVVPREGSLSAVKERPPIHEFLRRLLYHELNLQNAGATLKLLVKADWENEELAAYLIKCLANAWNVKYFHIKTMAWLVSELSRYHEKVQIHVVDAVIEDIRLGLEAPLPKFNQRRIAMIKYIGELYYYHLIDTADVLKIFYLLITLGVTFDYGALPSPLDPPGHVFRLKLVCVLLETAGPYFSSATNRRKLDYFLVFFQNYYWYKRCDPIWTDDNPFPIRMQLLVRDAIVTARPKIIVFQNAEEAAEAVEELKNHFLAKVGAAESSSQAGQLNKIDEEDASSGDEDPESTSLSLSQSQGDDVPILREFEESKEVKSELACAEDEDFMSAFDKIVAEQMQDRKSQAPPQQMDISVPMHVRSNFKKTYEQLNAPAPPEQPSSVNFILMLRKGNKQTYKNVDVPVTSELAQNLKQQEAAVKMEMEKVKKLTLDTYERLEEEDYQDMISQTSRPTVSNLNRDRKQKYQHPKGAPDADLIFGKGK